MPTQIKKDNVEETEAAPELPIYKLVMVQVVAPEDCQKLEDQVNELIAQGYRPHGSIAVDHSSEAPQGYGTNGNIYGHTDYVQPMVREGQLPA
jgi:hypothetical protein